MFSNHFNNFLYFRKVFSSSVVQQNLPFPCYANNPSKVCDFFFHYYHKQNFGFSWILSSSTQKCLEEQWHNVRGICFDSALFLSVTFNENFSGERKVYLSLEEAKPRIHLPFHLVRFSFITESCKDNFRWFNFQIYSLYLKWFTKPHKNLHGKGEEQEQNYI